MRELDFNLIAWREYLIERDMAHWSVDPATGEVSFVLEEPEHDAERSD